MDATPGAQNANIPGLNEKWNPKWILELYLRR